MQSSLLRAPRRALDRVRTAIVRNLAFSAVFGAFVVWAYRILLASPIGPGQDQHYHLMSAALTARWWIGDPQVRALYKFINPLDCNTLAYSLLFPLELILSPVDAWRWGFGTLYFVGYPIACAVALRLMRRPLWGAILAFPLAYVKCWSQGGYMPFVSSAPFFVLALAGMHRLLNDDGSERTATRRRLIALTAIASTLTCLGHGHVYTWLMLTLGTLTLGTQLRILVPGFAIDPARAWSRAIGRGLLALATVLPSLTVFASWHFRLHYGSNATHETGYIPTHETLQTKWTIFLTRFIHTTSDREWAFLALLLVVAVFALLLSGRPRRGELPSPEIAFSMTLASYFILPFAVTGTDLGLRQPDFLAWLLPLIVYPSAAPRAVVKNALVVATIIGFAAYRLGFIEKQLRAFHHEVRGLFELAASCPSSSGELAYATFGSWSSTWVAPSLHQPHETYAAICRIDTPVYDPTEYPHNFLPVRYRGKPPSPVTILVDNQRWYAHPNIWKDFELVLVRNWTPTPSQLDQVNRVASVIRSSGEWQLWQRRPRE